MKVNTHTHKARYFFKQFFLLNLSINECNKEFPRNLLLLSKPGAEVISNESDASQNMEAT